MSEYNVYIIEIMPRWHNLVAPGLSDGKKCFYVGETSILVAERYSEHRTGRVPARRSMVKPGKVFNRLRKETGKSLRRKRDVRLRRSLMREYRSQLDGEAAKALEWEVVDELRSQGHCVHPKGVGDIPFKSYRTHERS
jgi:hypothetical protein